MDSRPWRAYSQGTSRNRQAPANGFERYVDRFGRPVGIIYEDLPCDGRSGIPSRRFVNVNEFDHYALDPRTSNFTPGNFIHSPERGRSYRTRRLNSIPQQYNLADDLSNLNIRPKSGGDGMEHTKFGKAMRGLHSSIEKANSFYTTFLGEYDTETSAAKKYATRTVLGQLWIMKAGGEKDPQTLHEGEIQHGEKERMADMRRNFEEMRRRVQEAMKSAINSLPLDLGHSDRSQVRAEDAERLKEKIETAYSQIVDLLDRAPKTRDHCQSLTEELKLLMDLVDPQSNKNKRLFRDDDSDEEESSGGSAEASPADDAVGWDNN